VTATRGLAIGALAADCAPVLFADPEARVVAAAHAGWRGAVAGVVEAAVAAMIGAGAARARIRVAVGPCIGWEVYEVGPEFEEEVLARDPASRRYFARRHGDARSRFDLPGYIVHRLAAMDLAVVEQCTPCTYRNESIFFSYRRARARGDPDYGRQISAIVVA
jgi:YfiH family protein